MARRGEANVIDGMKGPRETRMDELKNLESQERAMQDVSTARPEFVRPTGTTYQSKWLRFRKQILPDITKKDEFGNFVIVQRGYAAQFENGVWVNDYDKGSDEENQKVREYADKKLQSDPKFGRYDPVKGIPGHAVYWLAEDLARTVKVRSKAQAKRTMELLAKENPEEFRAFLSELETSKETVHQLPQREVNG